MPVDKVPEKNSILFVWLNNYAGVLIKTPTRTLLIDPVDVKARNFPKVDAILITHEHYDHLDQRLIAEFQKTTGCAVIADATSIKSLKTNLSSNKLYETKPGDHIKIGAVNVKSEKCNHKAAASPVSFIITSEDGVKIFHTADSMPYPEMVDIGLREKLDIVFCTVGIAQGTSPEAGSEIAWLTKPKVAIPYHTNSVASQKKFAQILRKDMPKTACLIPEVNKIYQISKGESQNG
ncbi:MAG: MBL fold metallo-hydrolase [Candidatus Bathyarchaeota archaeon]|nr:MBL fold metallo-hydrolase [Candidatus Bathyarchaeota archaeon]